MSERCPFCHQYHDTTACPPVTTYKDDYPTMTPDKYAEKVAEELMQPQSHMEVSLNHYSPTREKQRVISIISAALKRQREACYSATEVEFMRNDGWTMVTLFDAILYAEVDAPTDIKPIPTGEE